MLLKASVPDQFFGLFWRMRLECPDCKTTEKEIVNYGLVSINQCKNSGIGGYMRCNENFCPRLILNTNRHHDSDYKQEWPLN